MSMTIPQKKYFIKRIDGILSDKLASVQSKHFDKERRLAEDFENNKIVTKSPQEIHELVNNILNRRRAEYTGYYSNSVSVDKLLKDHDKWEAKFEEEVGRAQHKYQEELDAISAESTKIKDICMFGSEELAHQMLEDFIKWQWKQDS